MRNHKEKLRTLLEEYWRKELPEVKEREISLKIEGDLINDVVGPRRSGKTYLMFLTIRQLLDRGVEKESTMYISFENRRLLPLIPEYFNDLVKVIYGKRLFEKHKKIFIFLDEVQRVEGWERYIRSLYDEFKGKIKIFVSGSTSKLTASDLSYLLTGRHLTTRVFPLSFREFLSFKGFDLEKKFFIEEDIAVLEEYLREYMEYGGFPEVVLLESDKEEVIQTLFVDIINRDILPKAKRRGEIVEDLAYLLCSNSGKLVSFTKLVRMLGTMGIKVSVPTLQKYFSLMKEAFLFFDLEIFSYKVKDRLQYPRKIYSIDTGFVNFAGFKFSEDRGRLMENLVAIELRRKEPRELYYWKDPQGREVDFVVKDGLRIKQLIQVTYASREEEVDRREIKALQRAGKELGCGDLMVVTWGHEGEDEIDGNKIVYVPLWKWLLKIYGR